MSTSDHTVSGSIARGAETKKYLRRKGSLGAISAYVDEYPATKWDYERLTVYFRTGNWSMGKISEMVSSNMEAFAKTIHHSIIPSFHHSAKKL
jgi:hypothetical protein